MIEIGPIKILTTMGNAKKEDIQHMSTWVVSPKEHEMRYIGIFPRFSLFCNENFWSFICQEDRTYLFENIRFCDVPAQLNKHMMIKIG